MKPKIAISISLAVVIISYLIGFLGSPSLFIIFSFFALSVLFLTAFFVISKLIRKPFLFICFVGLFIFFIVLSIFLIRLENNGKILFSSIQALRSLPYVASVPVKEDAEKEGVIKYDQNKACNGINLFSLRILSKAFLMDMSGNIVHTWSTQKADANWHHVKLCKNGDLIGGVYDGVLTRLDWNSNVKWTKKMRFHHDIAIAENKDIYVLDAREEQVFSFGLPLPIRNDYIVILTTDGKVKKEISLYKVVKDEIPFNKVLKVYIKMFDPRFIYDTIKRGIAGHSSFVSDSPFDIFHNNTITIIDRDIDGLCKKGNILICVRGFDLIGIVDIKDEKLIWKWGPENLSRPHQPILLENGNILVYDNGVERKYSRIVELNPLTKKVVWEYMTEPPGLFYNNGGGGSQRLSNGNTLITEEYKGHVFEVTEDGEIVWDYHTPKVKGNEKASIYRMTRITDPENYAELGELLRFKLPATD